MKEPAFWHQTDRYARSAAPLTRALLTPLSAIYSWAGARRIENTEPETVSAKVICVGNLTLGGSGKTPVVAALREYLSAQGLRAASLSRGYKGKLEGPLKVDCNAHTAVDVGDEALMLSCSGEAWIGKDKVEAGKAMSADGVDIIIMDDGHQNPTLAKDLSIVVIDGGNPCGNGFVFPKGPLREPVERGLSRADAVIVMGELKGLFDELKGFEGPVVQGHTVSNGPVADGPLVAFAGIGRPAKFFDTLTREGGNVVDEVPYPDHHTFTQDDIDFLHGLAMERGARLLTTEKDYVRLGKAQRDDILTHPVHAEFDLAPLERLFEPLIRKDT